MPDESTALVGKKRVVTPRKEQKEIRMLIPFVILVLLGSIACTLYFFIRIKLDDRYTSDSSTLEKYKKNDMQTGILFLVSDTSATVTLLALLWRHKIVSQRIKEENESPTELIRLTPA